VAQPKPEKKVLSFGSTIELSDAWKVAAKGSIASRKVFFRRRDSIGDIREEQED
jgi:hypothetical protein